MRGYHGSFTFCHTLHTMSFINPFPKILTIKTALLVQEQLRGQTLCFALALTLSNFIFILNIPIPCFICEYIKELCKL